MKVKPEQKDSINKLSKQTSPKPQVTAIQAKPAASSLTPPTAMVTAPSPFGGYPNQQYSYPSDTVQLDIYNDQDFFYESLPSIENYNIDGNQAIVDLEKQLEDAGYESGDFQVDVRLIRNYLGSATGLKLLIQETSPDRLEVRLIPALNAQAAFPNAQEINSRFNDYFSDGFFKLEKQSVLANLYLFIDPRTSILVNDYVQDKFSISVYPYGIIFKLQQPLPLAAQVGAFVWIAQETNPPVRERVIVYPKQGVSRYTKIKGPNFDILRKRTLSTTTDYTSWDEILESNTQQLTRTVFSQSLVEGTPLNVDYTRFENFTKFSSAYERIKNFEYKVKLIESYQSISSSLAASNATGSTYVQTQLTTTTNKINNIIGAFDGFEKYMYFESSSYVSSSYGEFLDMAWPKSTSTKPYVLYGSSTTQVENWLDGILESASIYDNTNSHSLRKLVPEHYLQEESQVVDSFVSMLGHFFDIQYEYVNQIPKTYDRQEKLTEGFAKELVYHVAQNLGLDFSNGDNFQDLWSYTLGLNASGSYDNTLKLSGEDRTRETWKRIINNLPYLLKTKGTARGIRALINCYGIPSTIMRIREFGGPEVDFDRQSTYNHDRFYYGLNVGAGNTTTAPTYFTLPWTGSDGLSTPVAIELRLKAAPFSGSVSRYNVITWYGSGSLNNPLTALNVGRDNSGDYVEFIGNLSNYYLGNAVSQKLYIPSSSNSNTLFDGDWTTIALRRSGSRIDDGATRHSTGSYTLFVGKKAKYSETPLIYSASWVWQGTTAANQALADSRWQTSGSTGTKYLLIGSSSTPRLTTATTASFSGSIQEFRFWGAFQDNPNGIPSSGSILCSLSGSNLQSSPFYAHVISPTTIVGQNYENASWTGATSSYVDLTYRLPLGTDNTKINLNATSSLSGSQPNRLSVFSRTATFTNYTSNTSSYWVPIVETNYMPWPDIAGNRQISNKVRIDQTIRTSDQLYRNTKVEVSLQDNQPVDSPRLGIYLSPTDEINKDIAEQFGGLSMDDFIGSYNDVYENNYNDLTSLRNEYLKKNTRKHGTQAYIRLLREFNGSLFSIAKQLVPYRANLQTGLVVESDLLHRNKVKTASRPQTQNEYYETLIQLPSVDDPTGETANYEGGINMPESELLGDNFTMHEGTVNGQNITTITAKENEYNNSQVETLDDTIYRNVTSYGRDNILGTQYNFYTWFSTGSLTGLTGFVSNSAGFIYNNSVGEDYWNPIALSATRAKASEVFTPTEVPYNVYDFFNGTGSFDKDVAGTVYTGSYFNTALGRFGFRFTTSTASVQYSQYNSTLTPYFPAGTAGTASFTVPVFYNTVYPNTIYQIKVQLKYETGGDPMQNPTMSFAFGSGTSSYTRSLPLTQTLTSHEFYTKADGPYLWTNIQTNQVGLDEISVLIDDLQITPYIKTEIQDYQVGPLASIGQRNQKYDGCKLTAADFNEDSPDTIDGGPVIEIITGPGANIAVNPTNNPNQVVRDGFRPAQPPTSTPRNTTLLR